MKTIYFLLLLVPLSFFAMEMEPPLKKSKDEAQPMEIVPPQCRVPPLKDLTADYITRNYLLFCDEIKNFPAPVCKELIVPRYKALLEKTYEKKIALAKSKKLIHKTATDSYCYSVKGGNHIISVHKGVRLAEIFAKKDILNETFKLPEWEDFASQDQIKNIPTNHIAFSAENFLYIIQDFILTRHGIYYQENERAKFSEPCTYTITPRLQGTIEKVIEKVQKDVFVVTKVDNKLNLYSITKFGHSSCLGIYPCDNQIFYVYTLPENKVLVVFSDGKIHIIDKKLHQSYYDLFDNKKNILCCDLDQKCEQLALSFDNGELEFYHIKSQKYKIVSNPALQKVFKLFFYNPENIILINSSRNEIKTSEKFSLLFFNIDNEKVLAQSCQKETINCNQIDVHDPDYILMGMGYYDIALHPFEDFTIDLSSFNFSKLCKKPHVWKMLSLNDTQKNKYLVHKKKLFQKYHIKPMTEIEINSAVLKGIYKKDPIFWRQIFGKKISELTDQEKRNYKLYKAGIIAEENFFTESDLDSMVFRHLFQTDPHFFKSLIDKQLSFNDKIIMLLEYSKRDTDVATDMD